METTIRQRLMKLIENEKISIREFERLVGASNGYTKNVKNSITSKVLSGIMSAFPTLNSEWLLHGEGDMYKPQSVVQNNNKGDNINTHTLELSDTGKALLDLLKTQSEQLSITQAQVNKSQEQIDKLLDMLEEFRKAQFT